MKKNTPDCQITYWETFFISEQNEMYPNKNYVLGVDLNTDVTHASPSKQRGFKPSRGIEFNPLRLFENFTTVIALAYCWGKGTLMNSSPIRIRTV